MQTRFADYGFEPEKTNNETWWGPTIKEPLTEGRYGYSNKLRSGNGIRKKFRITFTVNKPLTNMSDREVAELINDALGFESDKTKYIIYYNGDEIYKNMDNALYENIKFCVENTMLELVDYDEWFDFVNDNLDSVTNFVVGDIISSSENDGLATDPVTVIKAMRHIGYDCANLKDSDKLIF